MNSRGRPRAFDVEDAVQTAQTFFWKHGLSATSLNELLKSLGLNKSSFYAAFGDKQQIYLLALDAYLEMSGGLVRTAMEKPDLRESLETFFAADLDLFLARGGQGCFLVTTAIPASQDNTDVASRVAAVMNAIPATFRWRLDRALASGQLGADADIMALSEILTSLHFSLAVRARSGATRDELERSIETTLNHVAPRSPLDEETE